MKVDLRRLVDKQLIHPPGFVISNTHYLTMMGSIVYGCSSDTSDVDIYGFCIPPKDIIFPHLAGEIMGFGRQHKRFDQWQKHHVDDKEQGVQFDFQIFSIVKYFHLLMQNNPHVIDSLFVPQRCVLHCTQIGTMVREKRQMFLHKGAWHRFKGYAYSQLKKAKNKEPEGKRKAAVEKFGYDPKFCYHIVRLLDEVEQILTEQDIDLQRNREQLKSIRRGEWSLEQIEEYFQSKERELETLYTTSKLQHSPDEAAIKELLFQCLEHHYGSLSDAVVVEGRDRETLRQIKELCERAGVK